MTRRVWLGASLFSASLAAASACGNSTHTSATGTGGSGTPSSSGAPNNAAGSTAIGGTDSSLSSGAPGNGGSDAVAGSISVNPSGGASGSDAGAGPAPAGAPNGLLIELTAHPELTVLTDSTPEFDWIVNAAGSDAVQSAYRILVGSSQDKLAADTGDLWDSSKTASAASVNVAYAGKALAAGATYFWKVQSWDAADTVSDWSASQQFKMAASLSAYSTPRPAVMQRPVVPQTVATVATGHYFLDFGRAAFGWVELTLNAPAAGTVITVSLGEAAKGQAVNLSPGGSIRSAQVQVTLQQGMHTYRVATPPDTTNTKAPAILLPASLGVVMPFRYVEVSNSPVALTADSARQIAVTYPFDDTLASFSSSNPALNKVWALSKYTVEATTFADTYIDGDRERTPYEADAYIQALGHYAIDRDYALARASHEYLMVHSTWPTEWKSHSIMMAWADWMYTGNTESLTQQYALIKKEKTLEAYLNADGLLNTASLQDIVDWPAGERDGYVLTGVNTVVNSFWCHILGLMVDLATALGNTADATRYGTMRATAVAALNSKLVDPSTGLYFDGQTTTHSALHANMFPLAFGLVPADHVARVVAFVKSRGMACSVYGAQYLLESLYEAQEPDAALALLTLTTDRSWLNMINVGSTITLEAWDAKYKSNLDWNHAWGAAPANIIPRYLLGVRPLSPGFGLAAIQPQPGSLTQIEGTVATIRGPVHVAFTSQPFNLAVTIPANMTANIAVPPTAKACAPLLDGKAATVSPVGGVSWIDGVGSGVHAVTCQ